MKVDPTTPQPPCAFAQALVSGTAVGYVVCATPRRFARLPAALATTFAEMGETNTYVVFQRREEAEQRLTEMPPRDQHGWLFSIRVVACLRTAEPGDGPRLDPRGQPFAMRGIVVDELGTRTEWSQPERLGWRDERRETAQGDTQTADGSPGESLLEQRASGFGRRVVSSLGKFFREETG